MRTLHRFLFAYAFVSLAATVAATAAPESGPQTAPAAPGTQTDARHQHEHSSDDATVHHGFEDVERWVKMFDDPGRDAWQKPGELIEALRIRPGDRVADIGAGTGYFERRLSLAAGSSGTVYAVDVEPGLVAYMRARAEREGTANVVPVLASFDNPRLPAGSVDLVLIVDTFHHIDGRIRYFRDLRNVLRPGGRVAIVDFEKRDLPVGPPVEHKLSKEEIVSEMTSAGYRLARDLDEILPYQYALVFEPRAE